MRFLVRHVQQTIADYVEDRLTALGWAGPGPYVLGQAEPIQFWEVEPDDSRKPPAHGVVATLVDDVGPTDAFELGGGLNETIYSIFAHVRAERSAISMSIAQDIIDALTDQVITLYDYTLTPRTPVEGTQIEFEAVVLDRAPLSYGAIEFRRPWRVVTCLAHLYRRDLPGEILTTDEGFPLYAED